MFVGDVCMCVCLVLIIHVKETCLKSNGKMLISEQSIIPSSYNMATDMLLIYFCCKTKLNNINNNK